MLNEADTCQNFVVPKLGIQRRDHQSQSSEHSHTIAPRRKEALDNRVRFTRRLRKLSPN